MAREISKRHINFKTDSPEIIHEEFRVVVRSSEPITANDIRFAVSQMINDLSWVQPPLPTDYPDHITVNTSDRSLSKLAFVTYERTDEATLNAAELGYELQGQLRSEPRP